MVLENFDQNSDEQVSAAHHLNDNLMSARHWRSFFFELNVAILLHHNETNSNLCHSSRLFGWSLWE